MDEIAKLVRETYRETIANGAYPQELKDFFKSHERKFLFFDNLVAEFVNPKMQKKLTREIVIRITRELTHMFIMSAKRRADELNMSKIEQGIIKQEATAKAEMNRLADAFNDQGDANEKVFQSDKGSTSRSAVAVEEI